MKSYTGHSSDGLKDGGQMDKPPHGGAGEDGARNLLVQDMGSPKSSFGSSGCKAIPGISVTALSPHQCEVHMDYKLMACDEYDQDYKVSEGRCIYRAKSGK